MVPRDTTQVRRGSCHLCLISRQRKIRCEREPTRRRQAPSAVPTVRILFPPAKSSTNFGYLNGGRKSCCATCRSGKICRQASNRLADVGRRVHAPDRRPGPVHRPRRQRPAEVGVPRRRHGDRHPLLRLHLGERHRHTALGLPGRPLEPHQGHGGDDRGLVGHQRRGRARADVRLRTARGHPWHARLRPGDHRPLRQQRDRGLLRVGEARQGLLHPAVPQLRGARRRARHRRRAGARSSAVRVGVSRSSSRSSRGSWWRGCAGACPSPAGARPIARTSPRGTRWRSPTSSSARCSRTGCVPSCARWPQGSTATCASSSASRPSASRWWACQPSGSSSPRSARGCRASTRTSSA